MRWPMALLLPVLLIPGPRPRAADPGDPIDGAPSGPQALERLRAGEVLVESARTEQSGGSVRVQALMHSDARTVFDFIADCEHVFRYIEGMRECEILEIEREPGADVTTLRQSVDKGWAVPRVDYVITVRRVPFSRVDFSLVEGDLRVMEGGWRFVESGDALLVTHEIRVQPAFPVPRWLLRRTLRKDLPDMLACLRGLTGGSHEATGTDDLARCPRRKGRGKAD